MAMVKKADANVNKKTLQKLVSLGLNEKEAHVYTALLSRPATGSSALIKATGLHGQFVYEALERLEELGLAKHVIQAGRKKFSANSPTRLLALVEEKRVAAQSVVEDLQSHFQSPQNQDFEVYKGHPAFVTSEFEMLKTVPDGGTIYVIGSGVDQYMSAMGLQVEEYERLRLVKNVHIRYLSTGGLPLYLQVMAQTRKLFEYRILPMPAPGVDTDIYDESVIFNFHGDPIIKFMFKNKVISEGYKKFFEVLWELSTK